VANQTVVRGATAPNAKKRAPKRQEAPTAAAPGATPVATPAATEAEAGEEKVTPVLKAEGKAATKVGIMHMTTFQAAGWAANGVTCGHMQCFECDEDEYSECNGCPSGDRVCEMVWDRSGDNIKTPDAWKKAVKGAYARVKAAFKCLSPKCFDCDGEDYSKCKDCPADDDICENVWDTTTDNSTRTQNAWQKAVKTAYLGVFKKIEKVVEKAEKEKVEKTKAKAAPAVGAEATPAAAPTGAPPAAAKMGAPPTETKTKTEVTKGANF